MSSRSSVDHAADRRRFLKLVGLAGLSSAVSTAMVSWAEPRPPVRPPKPVLAAPVAVDTTGAGAARAAQAAAEGKAYRTIIERRYGKHLDAAQLEAITQELESRVQQGKRLRDVELANSDEPDFVFRA